MPTRASRERLTAPRPQTSAQADSRTDRGLPIQAADLAAPARLALDSPHATILDSTVEVLHGGYGAATGGVFLVHAAMPANDATRARRERTFGPPHDEFLERTSQLSAFALDVADGVRSPMQRVPAAV